MPPMGQLFPSGRIWGCLSLFFELLIFIKVQLIYNVVLVSAVEQLVSVVCVCVCVCVCVYAFFFILVYPGKWIQFPVLYSRPLFSMHSKCNRLHLTPNSQSICLPLNCPLAITSLFSMSASLLMFCRQVHLCYILDSTCK